MTWFQHPDDIRYIANKRLTIHTQMGQNDYTYYMYTIYGDRIGCHGIFFGFNGNERKIITSTVDLKWGRIPPHGQLIGMMIHQWMGASPISNQGLV
jgi:hypothetical protein